MKNIIAAGTGVLLAAGLAIGTAAPAFAASHPEESATSQGILTNFTNWSITNATGATLEQQSLTDHRTDGQGVIKEWNLNDPSEWGYAPALSIADGSTTDLTMVNWAFTLEYVDLTYATEDGRSVMFRLYDGEGTAPTVEVKKSNGLSVSGYWFKGPGLFGQTATAGITIR